MSSRATPHKNSDEHNSNEPAPKGKGKAAEVSKPEDVEMDDGDDDDEEEEDDGEEEEEEMEEDSFEEIDPSQIVGRRTRGVRVDYTSKEALEKAGLTGNEKEEDDDDVKL